MKIKELSSQSKKVTVELEIVEMSEVQTFERFSGSGKVLNAVGRDKTGEIKLTFWNEQITGLKVGKKILITDGDVSMWQGGMQLSPGRKGSVKVLK